MNLSDILRIPNTDVSDIMCIQRDRCIYMKESAITQLAEENHIKDIDALCKHVLESNGFGEFDADGYKLVRDVNAPWIIAESYMPRIVNDEIVFEFSVWESLFDVIEEAEYAQSHISPEANKTNQKISLFMERVLAHIKKVDYDEPAEIQRRIKDIDAAINKLKSEKASVEKKKEDKDSKDKDKRLYNVSVIVSTLAGLASAALSGGAQHLVGKMVVPKSKLLSKWFGISADQKGTPKEMILKGLGIAATAGTGIATAIFTYQSYNSTLESNIAQLESTKSFLEGEYKKALARKDKNNSKEKAVKESKYGDSIQSIMHEQYDIIDEIYDISEEELLEVGISLEAAESGASNLQEAIKWYSTFLKESRKHPKTKADLIARINVLKECKASMEKALNDAKNGKKSGKMVYALKALLPFNSIIRLAKLQDEFVLTPKIAMPFLNVVFGIIFAAKNFDVKNNIEDGKITLKFNGAKVIKTMSQSKIASFFASKGVNAVVRYNRYEQMLLTQIDRTEDAIEFLEGKLKDWED